ncbi:MAG: tetratricopeptide repeat protein [Thaumarchaeota archaeon]|nr:tetratricopeptide repeat protein [Nitrososphaerota archaeon]
MPRVESRIATVMFTEMVGYQDGLRHDESLANNLLDKQRSVIRRSSTTHQGRYFGEELVADEGTGLKGWLSGSGVKSQEMRLQPNESLVLFENVLDATRCAVEIQKMLMEYNRDAPSNLDVYVRIGIHVGDVTERDGEVSGEAVAVASRIAPLANLGGICLSERVYHKVRDNLELPMVGLGRQELKNLELPIEVYRLALPWEKQAAVELASLDPRRLAILPLTNMSADPNDEYFADGMTEELISTTSSITGLTLIARTSVMGYKGTTRKVEEIGKELRVGTVLEGSIRKAGNRLRITVQLIDVQSQGHLWAQSYDREFDDVFAVQSDVAKQVADALRVRMLPNETRQLEKRPTKSTEAHSLYLKGRYYWNERTMESLKKAVGYFEKAIEIDPVYAMARVGLADSYVVLADQGILPPSEALPKAKALATRALDLDENFAEAHATLGLVMTGEWDWAGSERELRRAIDLNPSYASAHQWYCVYLRVVGRFDEAMAEVRKAHELDPLSPIMAFNIGSTYLYERRYDEAIKQFKQIIDTDPDFLLAHYFLGMTYASKSMFEEAIAEIQKARALSSAAFFSNFLAYSLAMSGRREDAVKVVDELVGRSRAEYVSPFIIGSAYVGIDKEKAFEWLEKAYDVRDSLLIYLNQVWFYDALHSDPRYAALLKKMGLGQ